VDQAEILDDCFERMRAGASTEDCLAIYPEHAGELAPMLQAAGRLAVLHAETIAESVRVQAKTTLRRALTDRAEARGRGNAGLFGMLAGQNWLSRARVLALACGVAVVIVLAGMATAVVASGPGDLPYGVRVLVEQVPVWFRPNAQTRVEANLNVAGRRLVELQEYFAQTRSIDMRALEALMAADAAAMRASGDLEPDHRAAVAAAVRAHASALRLLATQAQAAAARNALQHAADQDGMPGTGTEAAPVEPTATPLSVPTTMLPSPEVPDPVVVPERADGGTTPTDEPHPKAEDNATHAPAIVHSEGDTPEPFINRHKASETPGEWGDGARTPEPPGRAKDSQQPPEMEQERHQATGMGQDEQQPAKDRPAHPGSQRKPKPTVAPSEPPGPGQRQGHDDKSESQPSVHDLATATPHKDHRSGD